MAKIITETDIRRKVTNHETTLYVEHDTIFTPSARDCCVELGIKVITDGYESITDSVPTYVRK